MAAQATNTTIPNDNNTVSAVEEKYFGYRNSANALLTVGSTVGGADIGIGDGLEVGAKVGDTVGAAVG